MKITFIGHASILIEAGGVRILSDPWWRGPCFGAQWWVYPAPYIDDLDRNPIDYIYISHGHHDHFHPATLRTLNRSSKVLVSPATKLSSFAKGLGFEVIEVDQDEVVSLGNEGVTCRLMATHSDDTLMVIADKQEVCVNLNDSLHSAPEAVQDKFITQLKELFPRIDYVFCGYGVASHFPNCYVVPGKDRQATAVRRQQYFNRQWVRLIAGLQPRFGFPFAADVVFLEEDLFWVNEPTHNAERPTAAFRALYPDSPIVTMDIAPGFAIQDGKVLRENLRKPVFAADLRANCADQVVRANRYGRVDEAAVKEVATLVQQSLDICADYLRTYDDDYRFLIRFRNSAFGIRIEKQREQISLTTVQTEPGNVLEYDVIYTTRLSYLKWSYTEPYGDEILFVGSGGLFEYTEQSKAKENLHREFVHVLKRRDRPPPPRYGTSSKLIRTAKTKLKQLLGRRDNDLYNLATWTVFSR